MKEFPFSAAEWDQVQKSTLAIVNATLAGDIVVRASYGIQLQRLLSQLRAKYGDHPILLETEADFSQDPEDRWRLYEAARDIAIRESLPSYSICLELAEMSLEFGDHATARAQLDHCEAELNRLAEPCDRARWAELSARANSD